MWILSETVVVMLSDEASNGNTRVVLGVVNAFLKSIADIRYQYFTKY